MVSVHDLFDVDPNDFVATRDALVKELRAGGDKEGAATVKKLRRPTVPVWALNRVARSHPDLVAAVLDATEHAQQGGDRDAFRDALAQRRAAINDVARAARDVVAASGRAPESQEREIEAALNSIAASPALSDALRRGELTSLDADDADITWPDLGPPPPREKPAPPRPPKPSRELVKARQQLDRARRDLDAAEAAYRRAQEDVRRAEEEVARLEG